MEQAKYSASDIMKLKMPFVVLQKSMIFQKKTDNDTKTIKNIKYSKIIYFLKC